MSGRTKKVAEIIAQGLKGHEVQIERFQYPKKARDIISDHDKILNGDLSDFTYNKIIENLMPYDLVLFGTPVYGGQPPAIFEGYLKKAQNISGKKFIIFCTCRFIPGKTLELMRTELEKKGAMVVNKRIFKGLIRIKMAKVQNFVDELSQEYLKSN
jgi:flavodoxin